MSAAQKEKNIVASDSTSVWIVAGLVFAPCLAAIVLGTATSSEPPVAVTTSRPGLVFSEYLIDYGPDPIAQQPTLTSEFYFRNNGAEPVRISDIQPSCGCLAPNISAKEIGPGALGKLTLPVRLNNEPSGVREYTVTVAYNDPDPRFVTLAVKVVLPEKSLIVEPRVLMVMGTPRPSEQHIVTISDFRPESADKLMHITNVTSSSSLFTAELVGQFHRDGANRIPIDVRFHENRPQGQHRAVINVATDDAVFPMIQIPVIVGDSKRDPSDAVRVTPETGRIVLNTSSPAESIGMTIAFDIPARWKVTHCDTFPSNIAAKYDSVPGSIPDRQTVNVQLSATELSEPGIEQAILTLNATDGDAKEMVTVPINLVRK